MRVILSLILFLSAGLYACEIVNLTGETQVEARKALINSHKPGVRIAYSGLKSANASLGLGGVNKLMERYEKDLCAKLPKGSRVLKTDFKGYFVECSGSCQDMARLAKTISPSTSKLGVSVVEANSYSEGYIKARVVNEYGVRSGTLSEFIDEEVKDSLRGIQEVRKSPAFERQFKEAIELYRKDKIENIDPAMLRAIRAMDVMLETPFANSNNIDVELDKALRSKDKFSFAQTGDDLFVVMKNKGKVEKVLGADARGVGVLNIVTRLQEVEDYYKARDKLESVEDLTKLSNRALVNADDIMDKSLNTYKDFLYKAIHEHPERALDESIAFAHNQYLKLANSDHNFLEIRAGALTDCGGDRLEIMNRITAIHNRLKDFEAKGLNGYFGSSCIGLEYWLIKNGLKKLK